MKKAVWSGVLAVAGLMVFSGVAHAQATDSKSIGVTVSVNARAKLTLGTAAFTFADADPDVTPTLSSGPISIDVKARTTAAGNVTLTVLASGDLASGGNSIAISNLTWSASAGFSSGTSNSTTAQSVGSWTGSGNRSGSHTYSLPNSWTYATGNYTATLNYTLTAP